MADVENSPELCTEQSKELPFFNCLTGNYSARMTVHERYFMDTLHLSRVRAVNLALEPEHPGLRFLC